MNPIRPTGISGAYSFHKADLANPIDATEAPIPIKVSEPSLPAIVDSKMIQFLAKTIYKECIRRNLTVLHCVQVAHEFLTLTLKSEESK